MNDHPNEDRPPLRIGPGIEPGDAIAEARERLRREQAERRVGRRLARRLLVAFVLVTMIAIACFVIAPQYGLDIPVYVPLACFAAIALGAIMTTPAEKKIEGEED